MPQYRHAICFKHAFSAARFILGAALFLSCASITRAQNAEKAPPVIDVHVHAMDGNFPGA